MEELVKITEQNGRRAVSARELHAFLESKQQFADWIKNRIEKYGFVENQDFEVFHNFMKNPDGGRPLTEYALSIDMAKELSMLENNEKGKQARRYFIACEAAVRSNQPQVPTTFREALLLAAEQQRQIEEQQARLEAEKPKVLFADAVSTSKRSCLIAELAKLLQQNGVKIGQNRLFEWMRKHGYLCTRGEYKNQPTQKSMEMGLFELKKTTITKPDGTVLVSNTTKVTGRGQIYFINKFLNDEAGKVA